MKCSEIHSEEKRCFSFTAVHFRRAGRDKADVLCLVHAAREKRITSVAFEKNTHFRLGKSAPSYGLRIVSNTWNCLIQFSSFSKNPVFQCCPQYLYSELIPKSRLKDQIGKYKTDLGVVWRIFGYFAFKLTKMCLDFCCAVVIPSGWCALWRNHSLTWHEFVICMENLSRNYIRLLFVVLVSPLPCDLA